MNIKNALKILQLCLRNTFDAFDASLESHESAPLFTAIMQGNDCDLLLAVSPSVNSMSS